MNWETTIEFKQDAEFLWHCWWLPKRFLNPHYAKGISALLGWKEDYRQERYEFWHNQYIAEVSYEGGLAANPDIFEHFERCGMAWREDRADALQNLLLLLCQNIERHDLVPQYSRSKWILKIIWHWQQLDAHGLVSCRAEADALQATSRHLDYRREVA